MRPSSARRALVVAERTGLVLAVVLPAVTVLALVAALVPVPVAEASLPFLGLGAVAVPAGLVVAGFVARAEGHPRLAGTAVVLAGLGLLGALALAAFGAPGLGAVAVQPLVTLAAAWPRLGPGGPSEVTDGRAWTAVGIVGLPVVAMVVLCVVATAAWYR